MSALIGLLSFLGFFVCIILVIINAIRKKPVKPVAIGIAVCFIVFCICMALTPASDNDAEKNEEVAVADKTNEVLSEVSSDASENIETSSVVDNEKTDDTTEETVVNIEYDKLQSVFIGLNNSLTEDELLSIIADDELEYTAQDYNGTPKTRHYKIAYEHGVALQKYADSGDSLEVSFSKEDGSFMYAEYFNQDSFMNAVYYNYGTYWDFREKEQNNSYTGYYYHKPGDSKGGITIQYSNGNSTETGYHNVANAEEAIKAVLSND